MAKFTEKLGAFFHKVGSDISRIHVRAAFLDVEHRVEKFFKHASEHAKASEEAASKDEPAE